MLLLFTGLRMISPIMKLDPLIHEELRDSVSVNIIITPQKQRFAVTSSVGQTGRKVTIVSISLLFITLSSIILNDARLLISII